MLGRLWTRDYILVLGVNFGALLVFYLLTTVIAVYVVDRFGVGLGEAGLAAGIFLGGEVVGRFLGGPALHRFGSRRLMVWGLVAHTLLCVAHLVAPTFVAVLAVRVLHGLTYGIASTGVGAAAQALIPPTRRAEGSGWFATSGTLAAAVGPFLALALLATGDPRVHFWFCTAVLALSGVCAVVTHPRERRPDATRGGFVERRAVPMAALAFVAAGIYLGVVTFLAPFSAAVGLEGAAGWFFVVYAAAILLARPIVGPLQDRRGDNIVVIPALLAFAAGIVVLAISDASWLLLTSAALLGLGYGVIYSALLAIAVGMAPRSRVGLASSTYFLGVASGMGVVPVLAGVLVDATGYRATFGWLAAAVPLVLVAYLALHGRAGRRPLVGPAAGTAAANPPREREECP